MRNLIGFFLVAFTLTASAVNLVPNSSFECGAGRGWQMVGSVPNLKDEIVASGFHGDVAARLTTDHVLICPPIWLTNGVQYVFSWYENANEANSAFYQIGQLGTQFGSGGTLTLTPTSWTRRSVTFTPTTNDYHQVAIWHFQPTMTLKVDAFQVEAGSVASTYAPQSSVEAGLATTVTNNTFFSGDTKQVSVKWWNDGAATTNVIAYEIFDVWNRKQEVGTLTATLASGATTSTLSLPALNGWHRVTTRITTVDRSWDELTCAVIPTAATYSANTNGILGGHTEYDASQVNYLRSAGFTWTRGLSPNFQWIRWNNVEATSNTFTFRDDLVYPFATNGLTALGTLTAKDGEFPAWAVQGDGGILKIDWTNYVGTIVNRYKSVVHWWEIYNEPQQTGPAWIQNYSNYATILTWSCEQIKAVDSTAKIVAIGGAYDYLWASNVWRLLTPTTKGQIDAISCHLYPNDNSSDQNDPEYDSRYSLWRATFAGIKPIWNTESGTWGFGGTFGENAIWGYYYQPGIDGWLRAEAQIRSPRQVDRITRAMFRSFGNGFARFFYYDSRRWTQQAETSTQPYSFEFTGSLRPTIAALAIAASFVDGFSSVSQITNSSAAELEMYVFEMGDTRVAVVFDYNRVSKDVATAETDFTVYDVMGNAVTQPSGKIRITKTPQYIVTDLTVGQITTVLQGTPSAVADTEPPQISVDIAPSGVWGGGEAFLKWSGIDQTYVNSAVHTQYVEFANHFDGDSYGAWSQTNMLRTVLFASNHVLWVKARDTEGNTQETNYVFAPTAADTTPPATPTVNIVPATVTVANQASVGVDITGEVGSTVSGSVTSSGGGSPVSLSGTIPGGGTLSLTPNLTGLGDGTLTASATLTDSSSNTSSAGTDTATKDTTAPAAPTVDIFPTSITFANQGAVSIGVNGEVGATVGGSITSSGGGTPVPMTGTIPGGGTLIANYDLSGLSDGTVTASATLTDAASNVSSAGTDTATKDVVTPLNLAGGHPLLLKKKSLENYPIAPPGIPNPTNVITGYIRWWVSSDVPVGVTVSNQWLDRIISAHAWQMDTTKSPTNSAIGCRFNGAQSVTNLFVNVASDDPTGMIFVIFRYDANGNQFIVASSDARGPAIDASGNFKYWGGSVTAVIAPIPSGKLNDIAITYDATSTAIYYTNGFPALTNGGTSVDLSYFGNATTTFPLTGYVTEVLYGTNATSAAQVAALHQYATNLYNYTP